MLTKQAPVADSDAAEAAEAARTSALTLLAAIQQDRNWPRIAVAAYATYLAVGRLAALARAISRS